MNAFSSRKLSVIGPVEDNPDIGGNFYTEPLRGVRTLFITLDEDGNPILNSTVIHAEWKPGIAIESDIPPKEENHNGIYAVKEDQIKKTFSYTDRPFVIAKVSLWGKIVVHRDGYRAQYAYPYEIMVPDNIIWFGTYSSKELATKLANIYQVDTRLVNLGEIYQSTMLLPIGMDIEYLEEEITVYEDEENKFVFYPNTFQFTLFDKTLDKPVATIDVENNESQTYTYYYSGIYFVKFLSGIKDVRVFYEEGKQSLKELFERFRKMGYKIRWALGEEAGFEADLEDHKYYDGIYYGGGNEVVENVADLLSLYDEIMRNGSSRFVEEYVDSSEIEYVDSYDEYGIQLWTYIYNVYLPYYIDFTVYTWYEIFFETLDSLKEGLISSEKAYKIAKALYLIPDVMTVAYTFGGNDDVKLWFNNEAMPVIEEYLEKRPDDYNDDVIDFVNYLVDLFNGKITVS